MPEILDEREDLSVYAFYLLELHFQRVLSETADPEENAPSAATFSKVAVALRRYREASELHLEAQKAAAK